METLHKHMFHDDGGLRYSLDTDASGELRVKVQPKKSKYGRASSVPAGCGRQPGWGRLHSKSSISVGTRPARPQTRSAQGSVKDFLGPPPTGSILHQSASNKDRRRFSSASEYPSPKFRAERPRSKQADKPSSSNTTVGTAGQNKKEQKKETAAPITK